MTTHRCDKEVEISEIHAIVKRLDTTTTSLDKALRGNGKPGLLTQFAVLKVTVVGLLACNLFVLKVVITEMIKRFQEG